MRRRTIQALLLQVVTATLFVSGGVALVQGHEFGGVARILLFWFCVLGLLAAICYWATPARLKNRPEPPPEFFKIRPGSVTPGARAVLAEALMLKERCYRKQRHVLYRLERFYPEGVWRCHAEEAAGEIIAWEVKFESEGSPLLDRSPLFDSKLAAGEGRFILVPSNLPH